MILPAAWPRYCLPAALARNKLLADMVPIVLYSQAKMALYRKPGLHLLELRREPERELPAPVLQQRAVQSSVLSDLVLSGSRVELSPYSRLKGRHGA
jgi:hypothetical protein